MSSTEVLLALVGVVALLLAALLITSTSALDHWWDADSHAASREDVVTGADALPSPPLAGHLCWLDPFTAEDIPALTDVRQQLEAAVAATLWGGASASPPRSRAILLVGERGSGKARTVRAVARQAGVPLYHVNAIELIRGVTGDSQRMIGLLLRHIRRYEPCILFVEDFEIIGASPLAPPARRAGHDLMTAIAKLPPTSRIVFVAASDPDHEVDRSIRVDFGHVIAVPEPDLATRTAIIREHMARKEALRGTTHAA